MSTLNYYHTRNNYTLQITLIKKQSLLNQISELYWYIFILGKHWR